MIKVLVTTDKFASRMIKNGERAKRRALFGMASAARSELRNVVKRKRKGPSKADGKSAPHDHGVYRNTALFSVSSTNRGFKAGFADFKASKSNLILSGGTALAQDNLEFGAVIKKRIKNKSKFKFPDKLKGKYYPRNKRNKRPFAANMIIRKRPHVDVAEQRLFTSSTKNHRKFLESQQYLIDRGYLK